MSQRQAQGCEDPPFNCISLVGAFLIGEEVRYICYLLPIYLLLIGLSLDSPLESSFNQVCHDSEFESSKSISYPL